MMAWGLGMVYWMPLLLYRMENECSISPLEAMAKEATTWVLALVVVGSFT